MARLKGAWTVLVASSVVIAITLILRFSHFAPHIVHIFSPSTPYHIDVKPLVSGAVADRYLKPPQAPPTFTGTPQSIIEDAKRLISKTKKIEDEVIDKESVKTAVFANTVLLMALEENEASLESHIISFYQAVSTDKDIRDASIKAQRLIADFEIDSSMREDLFSLVDAALKRKENLNSESQRLLERTHKNYVRNGLGLSGPQRDRFKEIQKKMMELSTSFQQTLNEDVGGIWLKPKDLEGIPPDILETLLKRKGEGDDESNIRVSLKNTNLSPILKYAKSAEVRKQVFMANENKFNSNVALFREIILLRDEAARILGYKNHAEFRLEDNMAKTPKRVNNFLQDLRLKLTPGGKMELDKLLALKQKDLETRGQMGTFDGKYYLWDHRFYDNLMKENEYRVDQQKISEYFPLETTMVGMLHIFEELFGLVFIELKNPADRDAISETGKGGDIVWHEDVQLFAVYDDASEGEGFVGYLYLDLFPRDGKYGHSAKFNIQPGFTWPNGSRHYPVTALVCNMPKPTATKPSLLKHKDVVTLFHELGHGIHDLVAKTAYSHFHGTRTSKDFLELPSQMLENWCWSASPLKSLGKHYSYLNPSYLEAYTNSTHGKQPPEQLPDDIIRDLIRTRDVNIALSNLQQLHLGIFDMAVHEPASRDAIEHMRISETYNKLRFEISMMFGPKPFSIKNAWEWGHGEATFGHLISGYDAGYYGYLNSRVYSADIFFASFKNNPMDGKEGRRYRHTVLERGGSQDEMQTIEEFLGRSPDTEAFYRELGLI